MTGDMKAKASKVPRIVMLLIVGMVIAGIALQGIGIAQFQRIWGHLLSRPGDETLALRFILQPTMSTIFAVRDGIRDARTGKSPYFWTIFSDPEQRRERLREGAIATSKILLIAIILDVAYQYIVYKTVFPVETVLVALLLAFIPYFALRGPVARIARGYFARSSSGKDP